MDLIEIRFNYVVGDVVIPMTIKEMGGMGGRLHFQIMQGLTSKGGFFKRRNGGGWVWGEYFTSEEIAGIIDRLGDIYYVEPEDLQGGGVL